MWNCWNRSKERGKSGTFRAECINLNNEHIKILGVCFSYNAEIFKEKNFTEVIRKMEGVLALWRWRNLTLGGKILIFKSLVFSKIVFISYLNKVPKLILEKINEIQQKFLWGESNIPKVKHLALIANQKSMRSGAFLCWMGRRGGRLSNFYSTYQQTNLYSNLKNIF